MTKTFCANFLLILLGALLFPAPSGAASQSLGEFARQYRKEMEARKAKGEVPVRVFTNDDIARMPPVGRLGSSPAPPSALHTEPPAPSQPPATKGGGTSPGSPAPQAGKAEKGSQSKEYWQAHFKAARAALGNAREEQNVVEEELRLLQIQQARELNPDRSRQLNGQIDAATVELETRRAATEKARQALEKLEKEFKESGAPQDWIPPENAPAEPDEGAANPSGPGAAPPPRR